MRNSKLNISNASKGAKDDEGTSYDFLRAKMGGFFFFFFFGALIDF